MTIEATTGAAICPLMRLRLRKPNTFMTRASMTRASCSVGRGRRYRFDPWREQVTAGTNRLDDRGVLRIGLDLAPDAAHQHVDAALERAGISALGEVEQAVARQHPARPFAEGLQQVELGAGHRDERAGGIAQFPQADVDPPSEKGERGRTLDGAGRARGSLAAQDRLDPGEQFA